MSLSHEHVGSKILAKVKIYSLSRAELLCTVCNEIPCILLKFYHANSCNFWGKIKNFCRIQDWSPNICRPFSKYLRKKIVDVYRMFFSEESNLIFQFILGWKNTRKKPMPETEKNLCSFMSVSTLPTHRFNLNLNG